MIAWGLLAAAALLSVPAVMLGGQCLLATLPLRRWPTRAMRRPRLAVVVPAHNESAGVGRTVRTIAAELLTGDRLIVVADNCTDDTGARAFEAGAEVWVRNDAERRGKGYALDFAFRRLAQDGPPEVVVCVDADCVPIGNAIDAVARVAHHTQRVVQGGYVMIAPFDAPISADVSALAVRFKNYVRPRGLQRAGAPCLVTGSGYAIPWGLVERVPPPRTHIVEDMKHSADLAVAGVAPLPCVEALFESELPSSPRGFQTQRTRWEHGHLSVLGSEVPRLFASAASRLSIRSLVVALDLMVPPLSLFVPLWSAAALVLGGTAIVVGAPAAAAVVVAAGLLLVAGLGAAWWRFGQSTLGVGELVAIPAYIASKASIYARFLTKPQSAWVRTDRAHDGAPTPVTLPTTPKTPTPR